MRLLQDVTSESEHIDDLEVSALRRHGEGGRVVRKIGAVSDAGVLESGRQFVQLVQYHHGDPPLIISDRVQMRVAGIDLRIGQQILDHGRVSLVNGDMERADALRERRVGINKSRFCCGWKFGKCAKSKSKKKKKKGSIKGRTNSPSIATEKFSRDDTSRVRRTFEFYMKESRKRE